MAATGSHDAVRAPRVLKVGTDFSGMEMPIVALQKLGVPFEHRFSSDNAKHCRTYIEAATHPGIFYETVCGRKTSDMPYVDAYFFSPPCQPFSNAGKRQGESDTRARGQLVKHGLRFMKAQRPRLAIMEQVASIIRRFPKTFKKITQAFNSNMDLAHMGS